MPRKNYQQVDKATQAVLELWGVRGDVRRYFTALGFSENAIRYALQERLTNGLSQIMTKVGNDYLADPARFVKWLEGYEFDAEVRPNRPVQSSSETAQEG